MSVSVILCTYNVESIISNCLKALIDQTFSDFELLVIDDSTDATDKVIHSFGDSRIKYFKNRVRLGLSRSRNKGVKLCKGDYVFFTDADCVVSKDWLEQGIKVFNRGYIGVEGRTYYVSAEYSPTFSDSIIENRHGGQYMGCNVAYKKSILEKIGGFDEKYHNYFEDRDFALRVKRFGEIAFNPNMIVFHQKVTMNPMSFLKRANRIKDRVLLFKKFRDVWSGRIPNPLWLIINPLDLMIVFCPILVFSYLFIHKFDYREDWSLFPFIWLKKVKERINLWKTCAQEKVFLI